MRHLLSVLGWLGLTAGILHPVGGLTAEPATAAPSVDPYAHETTAERDARMKWWREARFGMFIHWGVYSVPAGTYHDKRIDGIGEWIMYNAKIPVAEYREFAKQFNPIRYNADEWVRTAKQAGMKYIIITSKHHDGFAMFNSQASDWNIVKASPFGRDPLKELAAACRKHGLRLGFYYSQAQDWNNPGGGVCGQHWDRAQDGDMGQYLRTVAVPQVREILSNYGPISVLWWDTPCGMTREFADELLPLLRLQPGIIHNNRLGGDYRGDTETPEQFVPATGYPGRDWETCMTMNDTWGYKSYDQDWKPAKTLIRNLVDIASKGGNYLLNVGPTSEGLIPQPSVERLQAVGKWMQVNRDAIYGTAASPFKKLPWGRCTRKEDAQGATLFLHVFDWPGDGQLLVPGLRNTVEKAWLLAGRRRLKTTTGPDGVTIRLPATAPDPVSSTVVLRVKGALNVVPAETTLKANGRLHLPAADANLHGEQLRYESGDNRDNLGFWTNPDDWADWPIQVAVPMRVRISAEIAALGAGQFDVAVGSRQVRSVAPVTGDYGRFQRVELGTVDLAPGRQTVTVKPVRAGWQPMNLKSIDLSPAP